MKIWWTRDNTIPWKQLSDFAAARRLLFASRQRISVGKELPLRASGVFCEPRGCFSP